jgi:glycosyltransferase involved in cell wall biosynthesis
MNIKTISEILSSTKLELIHDSRTGNRLELVIPVFNEQDRLGRIIEAYSDICDIVIMDGGSTDDTINVAKSGLATVYSRSTMGIYGENFFHHYVNNLTLSGRCFYFFADECISHEDLIECDTELKNGRVVFGKRIDWLYGKSMDRVACLIPKGFLRDSAEYKGSLHSSLHFQDSTSLVKSKFTPNVHHLQRSSYSSDLGKTSGYINTELFFMLKNARFKWLFFRRFIITDVFLFPKKLHRYIRAGFINSFIYCFYGLISSQIAILILFEKLFLPTLKQQDQIYAIEFAKLIKENPTHYR